MLGSSWGEFLHDFSVGDDLTNCDCRAFGVSDPCVPYALALNKIDKATCLAMTFEKHILEKPITWLFLSPVY